MIRNGKTTSLEVDEMTVVLLFRLAETWGVSAEEAIHRALEQATARIDLPTKEARLEAFNELQRRLELTPAKAIEWQDTVREARR